MNRIANKGFTLIELLVVIAIIGILSSVVLASLNTARNKGANSAIKANLSGARAAAELFYDTGSTYLLVCTSGTVNGIYPNVAAAATASGLAVPLTNSTAVQTITTSHCNATAGAWAAQVPLDVAEGSFLYWCVDSTGKSKGEALPMVVTAVPTACI